MTRVNLLPWRETAIKQRARHWIIRYSTLLIVLTLLCAGGRIMLHNRVQQMLLLNEQQQQDHLRINRLITGQQQLSLRLEGLRQKREARRLQQEQLIQWRRFWADLPELMPASVWLFSVSRHEGVLIFRGQSDSVSQLLRFNRQLKGHPFLYSSAVQELVTVAEGGYRFTLTARLTPELHETGGENA